MLQEYFTLLKKLIALPSFSKEEHQTADLMENFLRRNGRNVFRSNNNIWAKSNNFESHFHLPVIFLFSHHDTVKPNHSWTINPFEAKEEDDKIFGLGSNDAGASLISLLALFEHMDNIPSLLSKFRFIYAAVAEEEITGHLGLMSILPKLGKIDFAIVGEPTQMKIAIAEKGLMVVDAIVKGKSGHAAIGEGINAIYLAMNDIEKIRKMSFDKKSFFLDEVHLCVTQIQGGYQHNVTPDECRYTIDIRTNEHYTHQDILDRLSQELYATLQARSTRLQSSSTPSPHPLLKVAEELQISCFGSPTISDWCVLKDIPAIKMGPGDSRRSHQPDEFIFKKEIIDAVDIYKKLFEYLIL